MTPHLYPRHAPTYQHRLLLPLMAALLATSCTTLRESRTRDLAEVTATAQAIHAPAPAEGEDAYIFIRLYNPVYKNPFRPSAFLQFCLATTAVTDGPSATASHASIGLSLEDSFFSLTLVKTPNVKVEHCTDISGNAYMNSCNPHRSTQQTYALKVTPEEYEHIRLMLTDTAAYSYDAFQNFRIAPYSIERRFFTPKDQRGLADFYRAQKAHKLAAESDENVVCSSFVAHILDESVPKIHQFFAENNIDWRYLTVADLAELPGLQLLFTSTWDDYTATALSFAMEHPDFALYNPACTARK